jgi:uncharacterized membrane protein YGL010W
VIVMTSNTKTLRQRLAEYAAGHSKTGTRITHMVGIPLIVASLPVLPIAPPLAVGMFTAGWALQFIGHYVFEKNDPAFFGDRANLVVGVIWSALEWGELLGIRIPLDSPYEDEVAADA